MEVHHSKQHQSTSRCRQAPGGTSTLVLGGVDDVQSAPVSSNRFADGSSQNSRNCITDRPSTKLHQAPGGTSTLVLGGDAVDIQPAQTLNIGNVPAEKPSTKLHQAPGGNSTVVLGRDEGDVLAEKPSTKLHQAPGGKSTVVLGSDEEIQTEKASVQVRQAPGGSSSIVLGVDVENATKIAPSSNRFADGSNQNAGNVLTDRPSTRLHQAPGGTSSIVLGGDEVETAPAKQSGSKSVDQGRSGTTLTAPEAAGGLRDNRSANGFANGSSQNTGNFITDRPTTKLHQAPGGTSTICLGSDSNAITSGKKHAPLQDENANVNRQVTPANAPAVVFG